MILNPSDLILARIAAAHQAVKSLEQASSPRALGNRLLELAAPYGATGIIAGLIPAELSARPPDPCPSPGCWRRLPPPVTEPERAVRAPAFVSAEAISHYFERDPAMDAAGHWVCGCARCVDARLRQRGDVRLFPIFAEGATAYGLGFVGPAVRSPPESGGSLAFIASCAFARMLKIDGMAEAPRLSERQRTVLKWAAEGKTDQEIAWIMNISGHTVDKYMRQIKHELNAVNRTSAIVAAMRFGLMS